MTFVSETIPSAAASSPGNTDLSITRDASTVVVTSSTGTDASIPLVDDTLAGVMSPTSLARINDWFTTKDNLIKVNVANSWGTYFTFTGEDNVWDNGGTPTAKSTLLIEATEESGTLGTTSLLFDPFDGLILGHDGLELGVKHDSVLGQKYVLNPIAFRRDLELGTMAVANTSNYLTSAQTTTAINSAIATLVGTVPATLDTLDELVAAALGDDPNFATTIATSLGLKAPLASPTFTGIPAAPTAAVDTATTQLATTAYVINQGYFKSSGGTLSGAVTHSVNGAASTPALNLTGTVFTGGTGTTTKPLFLIEPSTVTTSNTWDTAGTLFGGNAPSAYVGKYFDFKLNGTARSSLAYTGLLSAVSLELTGNTSPTNGLSYGSSLVNIYCVGALVAQFDGGSGGINIPNAAYPLRWTTNCYLYGEAAGVFAVRNSTTAQTARVYGTYTNSSNYVRAALTSNGTDSITLAAETAGTGADNLDIVFTPAGTGNVKFGTHSAIALEIVTGYITIKDSGGTTRKLAVVS